MSVVYFRADELANVAASCVEGHGSSYGRTQLRWYCQQLATISAANARAFESAYRERTPPITGDDIFQSLPLRPSIERARATAVLLYYNTAGGHVDHAVDLAYYRALSAVLIAVLRRAQR